MENTITNKSIKINTTISNTVIVPRDAKLDHIVRSLYSNRANVMQEPNKYYD